MTTLREPEARHKAGADQLRFSLVRAFPGMSDDDYDRLARDLRSGNVYFGLSELHMPHGYDTLLTYAKLRNQLPDAKVSERASIEERIAYLENLAPHIQRFFAGTGAWRARLLGRLDTRISYLRWKEELAFLFSEYKTP